MLEYGVLLGEFLSGGTAGSGDFIDWVQNMGDRPGAYDLGGAAAAVIVVLWFWRGAARSRPPFHNSW